MSISASANFFMEGQNSSGGEGCLKNLKNTIFFKKNIKNIYDFCLAKAGQGASPPDAHGAK